MADLETLNIATVRRGRLSPPKNGTVRDKQTDNRILSGLQGNKAFALDLTGQFIYGVTPMDENVQVGYIEDTPPVVLETFPMDGDVDVSLRPEVTIEFDKRMDYQTFHGGNLFMRDVSLALIPCFVFFKQIDRTAYIVPVEPLDSAQSYVVTMTDDVEDSQGNKVESGLSIGFTTL